MTRSRIRRFSHITRLPMIAAVAAAASVPMLGCFEEDQTLGTDSDSGAPLPGRDSGSPTSPQDSGTVTHRDSGIVTGRDAGATCGNGVCDPGETCSSCAIDCGSCAPDRDAAVADSGMTQVVDSGTPPADAAPPSYCPTTEGTAGTVLVSGQTRLSAMDIDTNNVYWTADVVLDTTGSVFTIPKSGAGSPVTLATNQPSAFSIAATGSTLYWGTTIDSLNTPSSNYTHVMSIPLPADGSATPAIFWGMTAEETSFPYAFATDSSDLYWYNLGNSDTYVAPFDGSTPDTIASPFLEFTANPVGLGIDATNIYTLWYGQLDSTTMENVALTSVPKTGGSWSTLWTGSAGNQYVDMSLFADDGGVYWVDLTQGDTPGGASIWSLPAGGIPTQLATGLTEPVGLVGDGVNLYYSDAANLWKLPITGGTPTVFAANEYSGAIRTDATYVYWADACFGTIKKLAK